MTYSLTPTERAYVDELNNLQMQLAQRLQGAIDLISRQQSMDKTNYDFATGILTKIEEKT